MTVWILTEEYNQYDQHGEYFVGVFKEKPSDERLLDFFVSMKNYISIETIVHILKGGGRVENEEHWFYLREEKLK